MIPHKKGMKQKQSSEAPGVGVRVDAPPEALAALAEAGGDPEGSGLDLAEMGSLLVPGQAQVQVPAVLALSDFRSEQVLRCVVHRILL